MESTTRDVVAHASVDLVGFRSQDDAVRHVLDELGVARTGSDSPKAVGHRIVHGGEFRKSVRMSSAVRSRISALAELAPLHNPPGLQTLAAAEEHLPEAVHVAIFDTAFHATLPPAAYTYPLPATWTHEWRIRRYGFHGLSHWYSATRAAAMLGRSLRQLRIVICHLGNGCSASAVMNGESIDTTMGFTPLDGLMMGTRSGSVDPGILIHVQQHRGLTASQVEHALNHDAGLLGVSGVSSDMREVQAAARGGHERAILAIDVYVHRVRQAIGALSATLGGIDALVFTAGVGENDATIRAAVCRNLEWLGLSLDPVANLGCRPDADITLPSGRARILVVAAREDLAMLSEVEHVIKGSN